MQPTHLLHKLNDICGEGDGDAVFVLDDSGGDVDEGAGAGEFDAGGFGIGEQVLFGFAD